MEVRKVTEDNGYIFRCMNSWVLYALCEVKQTIPTLIYYNNSTSIGNDPTDSFYLTKALQWLTNLQIIIGCYNAQMFLFHFNTCFELNNPTTNMTINFCLQTLVIISAQPCCEGKKLKFPVFNMYFQDKVHLSCIWKEADPGLQCEFLIHYIKAYVYSTNKDCCWFFTCLRTESSWCLIGISSYSAAFDMISINPFTLVLAFRDMLNSSENKVY